jgi:hypothetical protein
MKLQQQQQGKQGIQRSRCVVTAGVDVLAFRLMVVVVAAALTQQLKMLAQLLRLYQR